MKIKDLKINFRYLGRNIACLSVDSISGESVHNDINNEEAIIIFNSLVGEKTDCQTVKSLLKENQELKKHLKVPKACNLKTLEDYKSYYEDTTREQILEDTYIEYCAYVNLAHRYSELKKQVEDLFSENRNLRKKLENCMTFEDYKYTLNKKIKLETQQKEFIKYLEDETKQEENKNTIELLSDPNSCRTPNLRYKENILKEILQKYKETIGDDINGTN